MAGVIFETNRLMLTLWRWKPYGAEGRGELCISIGSPLPNASYEDNFGLGAPEGVSIELRKLADWLDSVNLEEVD